MHPSSCYQTWYSVSHRYKVHNIHDCVLSMFMMFQLTLLNSVTMDIITVNEHHWFFCEEPNYCLKIKIWYREFCNKQTTSDIRRHLPGNFSTWQMSNVALMGHQQLWWVPYRNIWSSLSAWVSQYLHHINYVSDNPEMGVQTSEILSRLYLFPQDDPSQGWHTLLPSHALVCCIPVACSWANA